MTPHQVQLFLSLRPFEPFDLMLADGRVLRVIHPDALSVREGEREAMLVHRDGATEAIDLWHVVSLYRPDSPGQATGSPVE